MPKLKKDNVNGNGNVKTEIRGRVENPVTKRPAGSLEEIWSTARKPMDLVGYEDKLKNMTLVDLQVHARDEYGLFPKDNKERMINACREQFVKKKSSQAGRFVKGGTPGMTRENKEAVLELLKRSK